jgi:hypothetical protein
MKKTMRWLRLFPMMALFGCGSSNDVAPELKADYPKSLQVTLENPTNLTRTDEAVTLQVQALKTKAIDFNPQAFVIVSGAEEIPSQFVGNDGEGEIVLVTNFAPNEKKTIIILYADSGEKMREYPKRTQAELSQKFGGKFENKKYIGGAFQNVSYARVPAEHTDHSEFFRYEGPGWESDKVGYRFYLDWRNAIDIFGKKTPDMVLQNVGQDGFDSYHNPADWGMDILKVGDALGIGTIAMWHDGKANRVAVTDSVTCEIVANGPVFSEVETQYFGWAVGDTKSDLVSKLTITAGSRMTKHVGAISNDVENLCTGIGKLENSEVIRPTEAGHEWTYFATFGRQSLANDTLGMAVLYRQADLIEVTEDSLSHVVVLRPAEKKLTYYFLGTWQQEPNGIRTKGEFLQYLNEVVARLDAPILVQI